MSPRDTVRRVLRRLVLVLSVIILGMTALSLVSVLLIQQEVRQVTREITPMVDDSNLMRINVTDAQTSFQGFLVTRDQGFLDSYTRHRAAFTESHDSFQERSAMIGKPEVAADFDAASTEWFELAEAEIARVQAGAEPSLVDSVDAFDVVTDAHAALVTDMSDIRQERRDRYTQLMSGLALATGLVGLGGLLITRGQSGLALRRLARPLQDLESVVSRHRQGSVDVRADTTAGATEVVAVATAFNELADENAELERARVRQLELYRATIKVASQLSSAPEEWDRACVTIRDGLGVDRLSLHEVTRHEHASLLTASPHGSLLDGVPGEDLAAALEHGRVLANHPEQVATGVPASLAAAAERHGVASWVLLPLAVPDNTFGVLCVARWEPYRWPGGELDALDRFAGYLTTALAVRRMMTSMYDLDRQKSDFMATTSHELRTPLTSMAGYLELLEDGDFGPLNERQAQALGVVSRNAGRLRALIDDLLLLNRLDSGQASMHRRPVEVHEVISRVVESMHPVARNAQVDLRVGEVAQPAPVRADRDQLERALGNVVSNAIKFTNIGGQVRLSATVEEDLVLLECTDTGMGIPEADLAGLFTQFYRASNAQQGQVQGTGLGLAIVRKIAESHGGSVELASQEGVGTTVTLSLPLLDPATPEEPADG